MTEWRIGEVPQSERVKVLAEREIRAFTDSPALNDLMTGQFGYTPLEGNPTFGEQLKHKFAFAKNGWQWNKDGQERNQAPKIELSDEQRRAIIGDDENPGAASELGMVEASKAQKERYDAKIHLGGQARHPLWRAVHGKEDGGKAPQVFLLGSEATFKKEALQTAQKKDQDAGTEVDPRVAAYDKIALSDEAKTEFDLQIAAAEVVYGQLQADGTYKMPDTYEATDQQTEAGKVREYRYTGDGDPLENPNIYVVSAVNREDASNPRVTSGDQYALVVDLLAPEAKSVLTVTGSNFSRFQKFDALRTLTLEHDLEVETIGFSNKKPPLCDIPTVFHTADAYLKEVYSALTGADAFYEAVGSSSSK